MDGEDVLGVLAEIRDEVRQTNGHIQQTNSRLDQTNSRLDQTNSRLDQTNSRLESVERRLESVDGRLHLVEGRLEFLGRSVTKGFADTREALADHAERIERLVAGQAVAMDNIRGLIEQRLNDHARVLSHEDRIRALELRTTE